jgi:hypothetical protein
VTTVSIVIRNSNEEPIHLQVDPWAGVYLLKKHDEIHIVAESETTSPSFHLEEYNNTRILLIENSSEYYIVRSGQRVHWTLYQSNLEG